MNDFMKAREEERKQAVKEEATLVALLKELCKYFNKHIPVTGAKWDITRYPDADSKPSGMYGNYWYNVMAGDIGFSIILSLSTRKIEVRGEYHREAMRYVNAERPVAGFNYHRPAEQIGKAIINKVYGTYLETVAKEREWLNRVNEAQQRTEKGAKALASVQGLKTDIRKSGGHYDSSTGKNVGGQVNGRVDVDVPDTGISGWVDACGRLEFYGLTIEQVVKVMETLREFAPKPLKFGKKK